jgi:transcription elongation factor Elf1
MPSHTLTQSDEWFIQKGHMDALSRTPFDVGHQVVVCGNLHVLLAEFYDGKCPLCGSAITIPFSREILNSRRATYATRTCPHCYHDVGLITPLDAFTETCDSRCPKCRNEITLIERYQTYSIGRHTLTSSDDWFIQKGHKDSLSRSPFGVGQEVVVCENFHVMLAEFRHRRCPSCGSEKTIPFSREILDSPWAKYVLKTCPHCYHDVWLMAPLNAFNVTYAPKCPKCGQRISSKWFDQTPSGEGHPHSHTLTSSDDWFIQKGHKDSLSRSPFGVGQEVVVCENFHVMLAEFRHGSCPSCGSEKTIPFSREILDSQRIKFVLKTCPHCYHDVGLITPLDAFNVTYAHNCPKCGQWLSSKWFDQTPSAYPYRHTLTPSDEWFIQKGHKDSLSRSPFGVGQEVVVCENFHVMLAEFRHGSCPSCGSEKTIPFSREILDSQRIKHAIVPCPECNRYVEAKTTLNPFTKKFETWCPRCRGRINLTERFWLDTASLRKYRRRINFLNQKLQTILWPLIIALLSIFIFEYFTDIEILQNKFSTPLQRPKFIETNILLKPIFMNKLPLSTYILFNLDDNYFTESILIEPHSPFMKHLSAYKKLDRSILYNTSSLHTKMSIIIIVLVAFLSLYLVCCYVDL